MTNIKNEICGNYELMRTLILYIHKFTEAWHVKFLVMMSNLLMALEVEQDWFHASFIINFGWGGLSAVICRIPKHYITNQIHCSLQVTIYCPYLEFRLVDFMMRDTSSSFYILCLRLWSRRVKIAMSNVNWLLYLKTKGKIRSE